MSSALASASATLAASASASASSASSESSQPASFKIIGLILAILSGVFIGSSFVVKKKGLLRSLRKTGTVAGEGGHAYLKDWLWWTGMSMMIIGEICNLVAYSFTAAVLVTPLGALSVVICAILSHFFLKETLTFFGWVGCFLCIVGSVIIAINAPEQAAVTEIRPFMHLFIAPGFLAWMAVMIALALAGVFYFEPRYGKRTMLVHIGICSVIGGLSVSCTQGLGASILTSIRGANQVTYWFFWFLFVFVVITLLVEINYLNKALELFNTAMVTPTYYVMFTFCTLVSSIILYQGLETTALGIVTIVMGFLVICAGITILQMSKVDPEKIEGLDRKSTILLQATSEPKNENEKEIAALEDPGVDALRGGFGTVGSIIRARSRRASSLAHSINSGRSRVDSQSFNPRDPFSLSSIPRYQLTDEPAPMGNPYHEQLQRYNSSALHPDGPNRGEPSPSRMPTLRFDSMDQVHRVGRAGHPEEAVHSRQHHASQPPPPSPSSRNNSAASHDYAVPAIRTIPESPEADYSVSPGQLTTSLPPIGKHGYPSSAPPTSSRFNSSTYQTDRSSVDDHGVHHGSDLGHSGHTLPLGGDRRASNSSRGRDGSGPAPGGERSRENSTSHRSPYPRMSKKREAELEFRQERRGLVDGSDESSENGSSGDGRGSSSEEDDGLDDLFVARGPAPGLGSQQV